MDIPYDFKRSNFWNGDFISVSGKTRDWEALARKIALGNTVEEAAEEAGVPLDEVFTYISERMGLVDTLNFQLRLIGQGAIKKALTKLSTLAEGDAREGKDFESTDLMAARELARLGIESLKLSRSGLSKRGEGDAQKDLFDLADSDPWNLKKVE